jgi:hypothetical protein
VIVADADPDPAELDPVAADPTATDPPPTQAPATGSAPAPGSVPEDPLPVSERPIESAWSNWVFAGGGVSSGTPW